MDRHLGACPIDARVGRSVSRREPSPVSVGRGSRDNCPSVPLPWDPPQPPPPRLRARLSIPLQGWLRRMIPAPVRSTPDADRRCIRLSIIMRQACDRYNPSVAVLPLRAETTGKRFPVVSVKGGQAAQRDRDGAQERENVPFGRRPVAGGGRGPIVAAVLTMPPIDQLSTGRLGLRARS